MAWSSLDLVVLGPPGSGKGTQARRVAERYSIPHVSTGDVLRAESASGTPVGDEIRSYLASGTLVPDRVVGGLVQSRIDRPDCGRGFLLDGFPRNLEQLALLDALLAEMGRGLERVVVIDVPDDVAVARLTSGPASLLGEHRDDVVRTRIASYRQHADAVTGVYRDRGLLLEIDGDRAADEVTEAVIRAVGTPVVA